MFSSQPVVVQWALEVGASLPATWAVFSDTDRFNRAAGMGMSYQTRLDPEGPHHTGSLRKLGMTHTWEERPFRFKAPQWFRCERHFHGGPAARLVVDLTLEPLGPDRTRAVYRLSVYPRSPAFRPLLLADTRLSTQPQVGRALQGAARAAEGQEAGYDPTPPPLSDVAAARLAAALREVEHPKVADLLDAILHRAPLHQQDRLHPTALAARLGLPPDEVVRAFLQAARAGALSLGWDLLCPRCRAPKARLDALSAKPVPVHCETCDVRYDGTFPDSVVVSFRPHPSIRDFEDQVQCILGPQRTPHVPLGAWLLELGEERVSIEALEAAHSEVATVVVGLEGCTPQSIVVRQGSVQLIVRSRLNRELPLTLRRRGKQRSRLSLGQLLGIPGALELLPQGALAAGLTATVGHGAALAVDEVLGRAGQLEGVADMLRAGGADLVRQAGERLVATYGDGAQAVDAAKALVGDLRLAVGVDEGTLVRLVQEGHEIPCGRAVDRATAAARALGAGRVSVCTELADREDVRAGLRGGAAFVDVGVPGIRLLRDLGARDRVIAALRQQVPAQPPACLGERYRLGALIGSGGQGSVYLATDEQTGEELVAKIMKPEVLQRPRLVQFFVDEARLAATLQHPRIPAVTDLGVASGEQLWMVMPRVEGRTLGGWVAQGPLSAGEIAHIARGVLEALGALHAVGLVHRDIKPENLMVSSDGHVSLLDLGVARLALDDDDPTLAGLVLGTPLYLAPEQLQPPYVVDGRTDLYALGLVIHTALTGVPPFSGSSPVRVALARLKESPPDLASLRPDLPPSLVEVVAKATARDPEDRFADAAAMLRALRPPSS